MKFCKMVRVVCRGKSVENERLGLLAQFQVAYSY